MSIQSTIHRIFLIINQTQRKKYTTFQEIINYLYDNGFEISRRTLERDIEMIRNEFKIELLYNPERKGYYIDTDNSPQLDFYLKLFEFSVTANVLNDLILKGKDSFKYIFFENTGILQGVENLNVFLKAIRFREIVKICHFHYEKNKTTEYVIKPCILKEYQGRWYVGALVMPDDYFLLFGIDRIIKCEFTGKKFSIKKNTDYSKRFKDIIGLEIPKDVLKEKIIITTDLIQAHYFKSLPLHSSQLILQKGDNEYQIILEVYPNIELKMKLLALGEKIKIIEPKWLANDIKETFKKALRLYAE